MSNPPSLSYATPVRSDLRTIAIRQRIVMFCILTDLVLIVPCIVLAVLTVVFNSAVSDLAGGILTIAMLAALLVGAVFVFLLAIQISGVGSGLLLGVLSLIPYFGLIPLAIINRAATQLLRSHHIHVGLLGADPSQIPDAGQIPL